MRILITGASGQLGTDLCRLLTVHHVISCTHEDLEITDADQVRTVLSEHHPDVVINTAAYHKVDECESFPEKTFAVNAIGPRNLAVACRDADIILIHISTNFVFDGYGKRQYREDDLALPLSVYGTAKLAGEHLVRSIWKRHFLIRTTGLYGHSKGAGGKGHNFIELMIKLGKERGRVTVVNDQVISPTSTADLAQALSGLLTSDFYGTYHITNSGYCSYFDFARTIYEKTGLDAEVIATTTTAFGAAAARPLYTVLDNSHVQSIGIPALPSWEEALDRYLENGKCT